MAEFLRLPAPDVDDDLRERAVGDWSSKSHARDRGAGSPIDSGGMMTPTPRCRGTELSPLHAELRTLIESAPDERAQVHELVVERRLRLPSKFRVLPGLPYMPDGAGQASDPAGDRCARMTPQVVLGCHCTNTSEATINGPVLALRPPNTPLRVGIGDR